MVSEFGYALTAAEAVRLFRGVKFADCLLRIEKTMGGKLPGSFEKDFRLRSAQAMRTKLRAMPGAVELVKSISVPVCVASSGPREKIELSLSLTGLLEWFPQRIFSCFDVASWKPEPGVFLHAAAVLGARPSNCVVIEDSIPGVEGALAAGMRVIAFQPGEEDPRMPRGVAIVRTLRELHGHLPQRAGSRVS